jgi:restriction system protein
MHWLVALASAAAVWALLEYLAQRWGTGRLTGATLMQGGGGFLILGTFARLLRFVVPPILVLGGLTGLFLRWRRGRLFDAAVSDPSTLIDGMKWQDFERVVADAFTHSGYEVREKGGARADGGVDLVVQRAGKRFFVQCKQWRSKKVDVGTVREMLGLVSAHGADGGFVVSAGSFTSAAVALADGRAVVLIDNDGLHQMMRSPVTLLLERKQGSTASGLATPTCPQCSSPMVKRVAKRGRGAGNPFWGCSNFPSCRGTRLIV